MYKLLILCLITSLTTSIVYADTLDEHITQEKQKLTHISAQTITQSQTLTQLFTDIANTEKKLIILKQNQQHTKQRIQQISHEIQQLDDLLSKRFYHITHQARVLQTHLSIEQLLVAIFSAPSLIDSLQHLALFSELSRSSIAQLEKQQNDKLQLQHKQKELEQLSLDYAKQFDAQEQLKIKLLSQITQVQLELDVLKHNKQLILSKLEQLQQSAQQRATRDQQTAATFALPIQKPTITSPYGISRSFQLANGQWYSDVHNGIDLVNGNSSTPILSVANGIVVWSGYQLQGGNGIIVKLTNGLYAHYFHLSTAFVTIGQAVSKGQPIGIIGATGLYVTGIHLHFGLSKNITDTFVNPTDYLPL